MASTLCAPSPWIATPLPQLLPTLLALTATACATATTGNIRSDCETGNATACSEWGQQLLTQGEKQMAENAFARSCEGGNAADCVYQGRLMVERGELTAAEPPLLKAYEAEYQEGAYALADLHQARAGPGDVERAEHLRWQALAIDKPDREIVFGWRPSPTNRPSYSFAYYFQPMALWSRRLALGVHTTWNSEGADELNAMAGYQYYLTPELIPYATLLIGGTFQKRSFNAGTEFGVKLALGAVGHLNVSFGTSVGNPFHASVGLGLNSLFLEIPLLFLGSLR